MKYKDVVKRSGQMVWRYRALWLFGALLALTTATAFPFWVQQNHESPSAQIAVQVTRYSTFYLPGEGLRIELTAPQRVLVETHEGTWTDLRDLLREAGLVQMPLEMPSDGWIILGVVGVVFVGMIVLCIVARYVSETALIRMVNETEDTGKPLSVRQGLRRGFSRTAWRLFLIDLALLVPAGLALTLLFALALSPLLVWLAENEAAGVVASVFSAGLLLLFVAAALLSWAGLSLLLPLARRACAVEGLGVTASIRRAARMARLSLGRVASIWLTAIGVRLAWAVVLIAIVILLSPVLLLALAAGGVAGGLVAVTVGGVLSLFWEGLAPWIAGIIVGVPILLLALVAPLAFVRGMVEVFLAGMWTLAYRDLRPAESGERRTVPQFSSSPVAAAPATR